CGRRRRLRGKHEAAGSESEATRRREVRIISWWPGILACAGEEHRQECLCHQISSDGDGVEAADDAAVAAAVLRFLERRGGFLEELIVSRRDAGLGHREADAHRDADRLVVVKSLA